MAAALDICQKQRAVIEFLVCENKTVGNIHKQLQKVYGDDAVDRSTVGCWAKRLSGKSGHADIHDLPCGDRLQSAHTDTIAERANNMIVADRHVTVKQLSLHLDTGEARVCRILEKLGYTKVCAKWVPQQPTDVHKEHRKTVCSELLERFENEGDNFLTRIVTGDETWLHYYEPETKRQSMEWHHANSPQKKKFRAAPSAGKVMATVFWDMEGLLLVDLLP
jgi:histone-lysine N-methyltransferase SETMAR